MSGDGNCGNCRYVMPGLGAGLGQCRRYAPRPIPRALELHRLSPADIGGMSWPVVDLVTDWCGEFEEPLRPI